MIEPLLVNPTFKKMILVSERFDGYENQIAGSQPERIPAGDFGPACLTPPSSRRQTRDALSEKNGVPEGRIHAEVRRSRPGGPAVAQHLAETVSYVGFSDN